MPYVFLSVDVSGLFCVYVFHVICQSFGGGGGIRESVLCCGIYLVSHLLVVV